MLGSGPHDGKTRPSREETCLWLETSAGTSRDVARLGGIVDCMPLGVCNVSPWPREWVAYRGDQQMPLKNSAFES